jgi:two-component system, NarL family, sensor histidine kinase UhpB
MAATVQKLSEMLDSPDPVAGPSKKRQDNILLIEDSEDAMLLVTYALQEYGRGKYRLAWASNLIDGLEQLSKERTDIVLLDLGLPESSGPASFAWVRQVAPETPVIVLTGDTSEETELSVLASGAADYLPKTLVSGSVLLDAIRAALSENKRRQYQGTTKENIVQRFRWKLKY